MLLFSRTLDLRQNLLSWMLELQAMVTPSTHTGTVSMAVQPRSKALLSAVWKISWSGQHSIWDRIILTKVIRGVDAKMQLTCIVGYIQSPFCITSFTF
jgi:hypothetical protein